MAAECEGSITRFVSSLKDGDAEAARGIWERYSHELVRLARAKLRSISRAAADEEDVALSAFDSFCDAASHGRFPRLDDRDDLWKLLVTITARKAADLIQEQRRQKRGGGRVVCSADLGATGSRRTDALAWIEDTSPSPEFAILVAEECKRLLGLLRNDDLRRLALDRMAGYQDHEIADRLGCSRRTVMRKLILIRNAWSEEVEP